MVKKSVENAPKKHTRKLTTFRNVRPWHFFTFWTFPALFENTSETATPRARATRARRACRFRPSIENEQKTGTFWEHVPLKNTSIYGVIFWPFLNLSKSVKKQHILGHVPLQNPSFFGVIFCHLSSRAFIHCIRVFFSFFPLFFPLFFPYICARARGTP